MLSCLEIKKIQNGSIEDPENYLVSCGIFISLVPLAYEIKGFTFLVDADYQILINSKIPQNQQIMAALHELLHIAKNDFDREEPVEIIESENKY